MKKDILFYELYDSIKGNCCPICLLIEKRINQSMKAFLYESVNDPILRAKLKRSRGMCNTHAHMLIGMGDPLAHAIIYRDLLEQAKVDAAACQTGGLMPYIEHKGCYYCESAAESERMYVGRFLEAYSDESFARKYKDEGMLCLAHLHCIVSVKKRGGEQGADKLIVQASLQKYDLLQKELSEIIRKHDYRYADEAWTDGEKTAWKRAVWAINDISGIRK